MYENLETLNALGPALLRGLRPLGDDDLHEVRQLSQHFPPDYLSFLNERGHGVINEDDGSFPLLVVGHRPIDAAKEYFGDELIYADGPYGEGAKGLVWLFGTDSTGTAFGFDSGDDWRLVEIDNARCITRLELTFKQFIEGLFVCYPQTPVSFSSGIWRDSAGDTYSVNAYQLMTPVEVPMVPGSSASSLSADRLAVAETSLGIKFSGKYVDFLRATNGGEPTHRFFAMAGTEKVVERFLSVVEDYKSDPLGCYDVGVVWSQIEDRLNDSLVPIAVVFPGDFLCLDFSESSEPAVVLWDHEESREDAPSLTRVAPSFQDFVLMLHD